MAGYTELWFHITHILASQNVTGDSQMKATPSCPWEELLFFKLGLCGAEQWEGSLLSSQTRAFQ